MATLCRRAWTTRLAVGLLTGVVSACGGSSSGGRPDAQAGQGPANQGGEEGGEAPSYGGEGHTPTMGEGGAANAGMSHGAGGIEREAEGGSATSTAGGGDGPGMGGDAAGGQGEPTEPACKLALPGPWQAPVGAHPTGIVSADFDADGVLDVATANANEDSVSVLWGKGDATFSKRADFAVGAGPEAIAVGDFDDDGDPDLATANQGDNSVSVLRNQGDGTFTESHYSAPAAPIRIVASDLNGDDKLDLALTATRVAGDSDDVVAIFFNQGQGAFELGDSYYTVGYEPWGIAAGDVDGDTVPDLAVTSFGDSKVSVLLNDGTGKFPTGDEYDVYPSPMAVALGDLNGDDHAELIVGSFSMEPGNATIWWNQGAGTFWKPTSLLLATVPDALIATDLDDDDDLDLAYCGDSNFYGKNGCNVALNDGSGALTQSTHYVSGATSDSLTVADFNGDGHQDLATANFVESNVTLLLGQGKGAMLAPTIFDGGQASTTSALFSDLDSNGGLGLDLVVVDATSNLVRVSMASPQGGFATPQDYAVPSPQTVLAANLTSDTQLDLLVTDLSSGRIHLLVNQGAGAFSDPTELPLPTLATAPLVADVTSDGKADVVYATKAPGTTIVVLPGQGTGKFGQAKTLTLDGSVTALVTLDLDGDDELDLAAAVAKYSGPDVVSRHLSVLMNQGGGIFGPPLDDPQSPVELLASADLNADGVPDLVLARSDLASISVRFGMADGKLSPAVVYPLPDEPRSLLTADVDGDGLADVASFGEARNVSVLQNLGKGRLSAARSYVAGTSPTSFSSSDVNGDDKADIAIANTFRNNVSVLFAACAP